MQKQRTLSIGYLFDDTLDNDAGVAQYVKTIGAWMSERGHKVVYMAGDSRINSWHGDKVYSMSKNLVVRFNGNKLSTPLPASSRTIDKVLAENRFDIVHVQSPHSPFMASRVIARLPQNTAIVSTFHILPNSWMTNVGSLILRFAYFGSLKRINCAYAVSEPAKYFAKKYYGLDCEISPNMIDVSLFENTKHTTNNSKNIKRVVFLGRLVERKGCMQLLSAFNLALDKNPNMQLIIGGDGPERKRLESYARKHSCSDKVQFLGYLKESDKAGLLSSADIAVFPSTGGESFGIVLLEAMASGAKVVLAGDNLGYRSVMAPQPELLVNVDDTQLFAQKLLQLIDNPSKYKEWQSLYVKKFDVNVVGKQVETDYLKLIK